MYAFIQPLTIRFMSSNRRNFWILLTIIAITVGAVRLLQTQQSNCSVEQEIKRCHQQKRKKRKKRKHCDRSTVYQYKVTPHRSCQSRLLSQRGQMPSINDFVFVDREAQPLNLDYIRARISYPKIARDASISGTVVMRILVDERGNYMTHKVIAKAHPILSASAEKHVQDIQFSPAIRDGKPVKFWVNVPISFRMP